MSYMFNEDKLKIELMEAQLEFYSKRRLASNSPETPELYRYLTSSKSGLLVEFVLHLAALREHPATQMDFIYKTGLTRQHIHKILKDLLDMGAIQIVVENRKKYYLPTERFTKLALLSTEEYVKNLKLIFINALIN